jgi:four helix bundle protein
VLGQEEAIVSELPFVKSFRELTVYQKARQLARDVFEATKSFPREETYSLSDQIRRSSRSIGAQIAEAWAKRRYKAHFISKLTDADGEQQETQHWIEVAMDCTYLTTQQASQLLRPCLEIGRMLGSMIGQASHFCRPEVLSVREESPEYFTSLPDDILLSIDDSWKDTD